MFFLRFITQLRFSYLDYVWLSAFLVLSMQNKFLLAFLAFLVGIIFSIWIEKWIHKKEKSAWQMAADNGYLITAIKMHRQQYGSTLKEAKDAVDAYIQKT